MEITEGIMNTVSLDPSKFTVLVFGGTSDSRFLISALLESDGFRQQLHVIVALAGKIVHSQDRVSYCGPFLDTGSLTNYLLCKSVNAVIVAVHPFSATIARTIRIACEVCKVPRLTLSRRPWTRTAEDHWIEVNDADEAAWYLPYFGKRAFLTVGKKQLSAFSINRHTWFLVRLRHEMVLPFLHHEPPHQLIVGDGQSSKDNLELMRTHAIDILVTKASGGDATIGKILAARTLGIPVLMLRRPPVEPGETVTTIMDVISWLKKKNGLL